MSGMNRCDLRQYRAWLWPAGVLVLTLATMILSLRAQGRLWWCACGQFSPWSANVWSSHNSQHLFDPYSFTHLLHGVLWAGFLSWSFFRIGAVWKFCLAVAASALWEVVENTDYVINRFREATISLDYHGDTIANGVGDVLSCALGFFLARRLGLWLSVGLFVATELVLLVWIRDNLTLNVLMLLFPVEAIKNWQLGWRNV